jgi:catechol 2,3-dioxygenase-like lactoylglutathione lyase family enzyme
MPKLRHVALHTADVRGTADFYKRVFDFVEVGTIDNKDVEGCWLSDGDLNMAVLKFKNGTPLADRQDGHGPYIGLHHIGFWVEDVEATRAKLAENGAHYRADLEPGGPGSGVEEKYRGPDNVMIDISGHGWLAASHPSVGSPRPEPRA